MTKSKPINILHVTHSHNQGGIENFILNYYATINQTRYNFVFLAFDTPGPYVLEREFSKYGAKTYFVSTNIIRLSSYRMRNFREVIGILKREKIDIVHIHPYVGGEIISTIAKLHRIPVIIHSHMSQKTGEASGARRVFRNIASRQLMTYSSLIAHQRLACSQQSGKSYFKNKSFRLIPNSIGIDKFRFDAKIRDKLRNKHKVGKDCFVLLHVGRFAKEKNHDFLIEIFQIFLQKDPSVKLFLVGDGPRKKAVEQRVRDMNLSNSVVFLGSRNDVDRIYNMADVFIMPSLSEGLGTALIEAQANGLPCLASDTIPHEANQTGTVSFFPLSKSASEWADRLASLGKSRHPENYRKLLSSGYNAKNSVKMLEQVYEEVYAKNQK